jgi:hypothetical protein
VCVCVCVHTRHGILTVTSSVDKEGDHGEPYVLVYSLVLDSLGSGLGRTSAALV